MKTVEILDTTLRDGAQAEGIAFSVSDKLRIAQKLDDLGVNYIEGGWPNPSNPRDIEFFQRARDELELRHATLAAFGSTCRAHIDPEDDPNLRALVEADTPTVVVFGKSWDLHVTEVLRTDLDENLRMIEDSVRFIKRHNREVIYDAEHYFDGYKADPEYALATLDAALSGGADRIVLCDTNGGTMLWEFAEITENAMKQTKAPFGVHVHNDSGLAVANTLEAVRLGVDHVQGTINGYGERCGNCNLCTIIPDLELKMGIKCLHDGRLQALTETARLVAALLLQSHDHRQPYVGASAFAHKGGTHVDGVAKITRSFEHVDPKSVGNERRILLSDQAGSSTVLIKLKKLRPGLTKNDPVVREVLRKLKEREHQGYQYEAAEGSFELLAHKVMGTYRKLFDLKGFRVIIEKSEGQSQARSEATIKVEVDGRVVHTAADGNGPVNALDNALRKALLEFYPHLANIQLTDFKVRVLDETEGTAAAVRVLIDSKDNGDAWGTVGVDPNIIEASWEALVDSIEYGLLHHRQKNGAGESC